MSVPRASHPDPVRLKVIDHARVCPGCGLLQCLPNLAAGHLARCARCHSRLQRHDTDASIFTPMALATASAVLYLIAIVEPLMTLDVYGRARAINLMTGPLELVHEGWAPVGALVALATIVVPAIVIGLALTLTISVARGRVSTGSAYLLRWYNRLRPWSMAEVYLLGVFVAYSKLIDLARTEIGFAVFAIVGLMMTMAATDATMRADRIWRRKPVALPPEAATTPSSSPVLTDATVAELPPPQRVVGCMACGLVCASSHPLEIEAPLGRCPRCSEILRRRKPDSVRRTLALLAAATIFYIPANLFPIMTIVRLYRGGGHTIIEGVGELYADGMLPLALLVFFASITVPVLKILSLSGMLLGTCRGSAKCLVDRSRLYWIVIFIGRWSMIDVFMVSILVGLVQFGELGNITANAGIEAFAAVVVLTIFAADAFDPRLMWDTAGLNGAWDAARPLQPARIPDQKAAKA